MKIKSKIETNHNYYTIVFELDQTQNINKLIERFNFTIPPEPIELNNRKEKFFHTELLSNELFSSESFLKENRVSKAGKILYRYDLYIGELNLANKKVFFISFPYKALGKYIDANFLTKFFTRTFLIPDVDIILNYMKNKEKHELNYMEKFNYEVNITKYTAKIMESPNAKKVSLSGVNPLQSPVYDILSSQIKVEPILLKLSCINRRIGELELSFDKYGNYRFWLFKDKKTETLSVLPYVINFFDTIKGALVNSNFITQKTFFEGA